MGFFTYYNEIVLLKNKILMGFQSDDIGLALQSRIPVSPIVFDQKVSLGPLS